MRATEFVKSPMKAAQKFSFCSNRATHPRNKTVNKEVMNLTSSCVKPGEAMSGNQLRGNRMHLSTIKPRRIRCDWALGSVTDRQLPARQRALRYDQFRSSGGRADSRDRAGVKFQEI